MTPYTFNFAPPSPVFAMTADSFVFVSLVFFTPFVLGFLTIPNQLFGPAAISGVPMFTEELNETTLWFGKAWAASIFLIAIGCACFGHKAINVTKQLMLHALVGCIQ